MGLLREPRPNMFQDVVNAMEQRLTLLEESGNSNLIPAQRAPPRLPPKGEGLEAIHEDEGDDVQEQDNKKQSEEGDETPEGGKEGEEGKEEAEGAKRKNTEPRQKRKRHEADSGDGLREKKFLDISGIMISLPDPEKVMTPLRSPTWMMNPDETLWG